jgi:hypothetical protein
VGSRHVDTCRHHFRLFSLRARACAGIGQTRLLVSTVYAGEGGERLSSLTSGSKPPLFRTSIRPPRRSTKPDRYARKCACAFRVLPRAATADPNLLPFRRAFTRSAAEQRPAELHPPARTVRSLQAMAEDEQTPDETPVAAQPPPAKRRGRPFVKGGPSPNPGGRPRVAGDAKEAFKGHLLPKALKVIERILATPKHPYRHQVAMYVVDRVLGKPTVAVGGADGQPLIPGTTGDNPLQALLARVLARKAAIDADGAGATSSVNTQPASNGAAGEAPPS